MKSYKLKSILFWGILYLIVFSSCKTKTYPNTMFKNYESSHLATTINKMKDDYLINFGDEISLKIYTRKGASLVEPITTDVTNGQINQTQLITNYVVSNDGFVELPIVGKIKVQGLTESFLKKYLEKEFEKDYQQPFVALKVENRRSFVFKGTAGSVVALNRTPTSLFEVLAKSGGLDRNLRSADILLIRGDLKNPTIYKVDLSTFEGIKNSEIIVQANDIIYVPERQRTLFYALQDIAPVITVPLAIITSTVSTIFLIITLSKK